MKNRLIIIALGLCRPGTMGGNSKIAEVHFILHEEKLPTLTDISC